LTEGGFGSMPAAAAGQGTGRVDAAVWSAELPKLRNLVDQRLNFFLGAVRGPHEAVDHNVRAPAR
jgi:hypothetical protein